jgi:Tetratricopeptide repeat
VFDRAYGPDHYEVTVNLHNLAAIEARRGDAGTAGPLPPRAGDQRGGDRRKSSQAGDDLNNLGVLLRERGGRDDAEALQRRAMSVLEDEVQPDNPTLGSLRGEPRRLLHEAGRAAEAGALEARVSAAARD